MKNKPYFCKIFTKNNHYYAQLTRRNVFIQMYKPFEKNGTWNLTTKKPNDLEKIKWESLPKDIKKCIIESYKNAHKNSKNYV